MTFSKLSRGRVAVLALTFALIGALSLFGATAAYAQATHTWLSGVGDDANPCSRTAPCRSFTGIVPKTAAGGLISILDPGSFGGIYITKALTIEVEPGYGGVLNAAVIRGVDIFAGPTDVVVLRGLQLQGGGTGQIGLRLVTGAALILEDCSISGSPGGVGIEFSPSAASMLNIRHSVISGNGSPSATVSGGILVRPRGGTGSAKVFLDDVKVTGNTMGIRGESADSAPAGVTITAVDSVFASNTYGGVVALTSTSNTAPVKIVLDHVTTALNGTNGLNANGFNARISIGRSTIFANTVGVNPENGGQIISTGGNQLLANTSYNGGFSSTVPMQ